MAYSWPTHFPSKLMGRRLGSSGLSSFAIALEAWRRGLEVTFLSADLHIYEVRAESRSISFNFSRPDSLTPRQDYLRLDRKFETNKILSEHSIPVPRGQLLNVESISADSLSEITNNMSYPMVLKPNTGSMGRGVFAGIETFEELRSAYNYLSKERKEKQLIIEEFHRGEDYRLLVVGTQVVGAVKRIPAFVVGDGKSSVEELIRSKNQIRSRNPFLGTGLIKIDREVLECLTVMNLELSSVPSKGRRVILRKVANASAGGDVIDVTDVIPSQIKEAAVKAVSVLPNIHIAGVDVLFNDSGRGDQEYVIIEINSRPQIGVNMYPSIGTGRDAPKAIVDYFFPESERLSGDLSVGIKFDHSFVVNSFSSGLVSKVGLPNFPANGLPYRRVFTYRHSNESVELKKFSERILRKIARQRKISGGIESAKNGDLKLYVASPDKLAATVLSDKVGEFTGGIVPSEAAWTGPVTVGFRC